MDAKQVFIENSRRASKAMLEMFGEPSPTPEELLDRLLRDPRVDDYPPAQWARANRAEALQIIAGTIGLLG